MSESITAKYKDSYVAFLDVLGFKNMVIQEDDVKLTTYFKEVKEVINELKNIESKKNIGNIIISDSIILTIEKDNNKERNVFLLRQLCIAVSKIQKKLALHDIWLRGAISCGKTYFDMFNNQIVGPAYINAYQLEEELAIYPRVIVDNKVISDLNYDNSDDFIKGINDEGSRTEEIALYDWCKNRSITNLTIEQDVLFFIDYLNDVINNPADFTTIYNNIKKNLYSNTKISKKFRWVINYLYTIALREEFSSIDEIHNIKDKLKKL